MKHKLLPGACLAVVLLAGGAIADELKSGPQKIDVKVQAYNPLHCSGPNIGSKNCLVWSSGASPVVMIFAREISDNLTSLVKKVDAANQKNGQLRSFVTWCNDDEKMEDNLKALAKKEGLKKTVLSLVDNKAGPGEYDIHKDADVTVVLYVKRQVKAQFAYKKGDLTNKAIEAILADLPKILGKSSS